MTGRLRKSVTIGACLVFIVMDRRADFYKFYLFNSRRQNGPETSYKTKDHLTGTEQFLYNRAAHSKINSKGDRRAAIRSWPKIIGHLVRKIGSL